MVLPDANACGSTWVLCWLVGLVYVSLLIGVKETLAKASRDKDATVTSAIPTGPKGRNHR
jgi:hypothetical protein